MADKFRDAFPVPVEFVKGEQPDNTKFTSWASQTNSGMQVLEKVVGNAWGDQVQSVDSGPFALSREDRRVAQISNIAGLIGPASALNPHRISDRQSITVTVSAGDIPLNVNEFTLPYPALKYNTGGAASGDFPEHDIVVDSDTDGSTHVRDFLEGIGSSVFQTYKASQILVIAAGDYTVDEFGRVYSYSRTDSTCNAASGTYVTQLFWDTYDKATMNFIPDVNETGASGRHCVVSYDTSDDTYVVDLPTNIRYFPKRGEDGLAEGIAEGQNAPAEFTATLPYALTRNLTSGDIIPDGYIYLWDDTPSTLTSTEYGVTGGAIVEGLTYKYVDSNTVKVYGSTLADVDSTTTSNSRYRIMTLGSTITETLAELRQKLDRHDHSSFRYARPVDHSDLTSKAITDANLYSKYVKHYKTAPSVIVGNDHPQYLLRAGYKASVDAGQDDNVMLGDLFIAAARSDHSSLSYANTTMDSYSIYMGSTSCQLIYTTSPHSGIKFTGTYGNIITDRRIYCNEYRSYDSNITMYSGTDVNIMAAADTYIDGKNVTIDATDAAGDILIQAGDDITLRGNDLYLYATNAAGDVTMTAGRSIGIDAVGGYLYLGGETTAKLTAGNISNWVYIYLVGSNSRLEMDHSGMTPGATGTDAVVDFSEMKAVQLPVYTASTSLGTPTATDIGKIVVVANSGGGEANNSLYVCMYEKGGSHNPKWVEINDTND